MSGMVVRVFLMLVVAGEIIAPNQGTCMYNGKSHDVGETFHPNECTTCTCETAGEPPLCSKVAIGCAPLNCDETEQLPEDCCPVCVRGKKEHCPEPDGFGLCVELCPAEGCPKGELCCSNGCGHECMKAVRGG